MASSLRSRVALFTMMAAFLIPISLSPALALRGLTHVLTCRHAQRTPFTLTILPTGQPELSSSTRITRGQANYVCGGLALNMGARPTSDKGRVQMELPITNHSKFLWRGTVKLQLGKTSIPVDIGEIPAGKTANST